MTTGARPSRTRFHSSKRRHFPAEVGQEDAEQAGGQGDLGDQDDGPLSLVQGVPDEVKVHLGLSRAGDAVEQGRLGLRRSQQSGQAFIGPLLLVIEV